MKIIKLSIAAIILACSFQAASAQVRVGVRLGTPPPRREVVVERPVQREVIVDRGHSRRRYYRQGYRRPVVVTRGYNRHDRVVDRRHY
ncbi:hypothetical protein [Mucilaginibacter sp.]|uniref:hypothetical protein n=1 Tax=Mucilaginibacter sp. TaxID=1882438 RepID=UPI00260BDE96|nr:hypothetical protein [Mucilaginibacter sp.]MDB5031746.1 hypothetical protein [Mucilaginibacter sp.]